jgi:ATP-binding protein involved in chromosome partitioning
MRIAVPVSGGQLCQHFGHCEMFALLDVDQEAGSIVASEQVTAPDHEPGLLPRWLAERGVNVILAGGMGGRAQALFAEKGIEVVVGAPSDAPEVVVNAYLSGTLVTGQNVCDH